MASRRSLGLEPSGGIAAGKITSPRNSRVGAARKLLKRAYREDARSFLVETPRLLEEALDAGAKVSTVFFGPSMIDRASAVLERARAAGADLYEVEPAVIEALSGTVNPQELIAVVSFVDRPLSSLGNPALVMVACGIQDPGNLGTALRAAEGAGADAAILCEGTVDLYNLKTVRASAGSIFHFPVVRDLGYPEALDALKGAGLSLLGATPDGDEDFGELDLTAPIAILVGNEAAGLPPEVSGQLDIRVRIPMRRSGSSLNAGVAASLLLFEARRQRKNAAYDWGADVAGDRDGEGTALGPLSRLATGPLLGPGVGGPDSGAGLVSGAASGPDGLRDLSSGGEVLDVARLLSSLAHDIRNPLTSVKGLAATLHRRWAQLDDDQKIWMAEELENESDRIARAVNELIDLARIERGRLNLVRARVTAAGQVERALTRAAKVLPEAEIDTDVRDDSTEIACDPERLQQMLLTLIENAAKHGKGRIRVGGLRREGGYEISVANSGDVVPAEQLAAILAPSTEGRERGVQPAGTGLAVFICRAIAELQGGGLVATSSEEEGTVFRLTLPIAAEEG